MSVIKRLSMLLLTVCTVQLSLGASSKSTPAVAHGPTKPSTSSALEQNSYSLQSIARQVEPTVIQILTSTYTIESDTDHGGGAVVSQQRSSGSGVLISSDGYIVTNAHVVDATRRLRVRLNKAIPNVGCHLLDAKLIGIDRPKDSADDQRRQP